MLTTVARQEDQLAALQRQAEQMLCHGATVADETLEAAVGGLDAALAAATRTLASALDEVTANCEDVLARATLHNGPGLADLVAVMRLQMHHLPGIIQEATSACTDAVLGAAHDARAATDRAAGDSASSIVCGCGMAEATIAAELPRTGRQCLDDVLRTARAHGVRQDQRSVQAQWGAMWSRVDDLCNASLQRCVQAAGGLGKWSASSMPAVYASVVEMLREALRRVRAVWNLAAMRIGRSMSAAAFKLEDLFARCESGWKAQGARALDGIVGDADTSDPPSVKAQSASPPATIDSPSLAADNGAGSSTAATPPATLDATRSLERLRASQATLAALLYAAAKSCADALCKGLERTLLGLREVQRGLSNSPVSDGGALMTYLKAVSDGIRSLQSTTRDAHNWDRAAAYEEVQRALGSDSRALGSDSRSPQVRTPLAGAGTSRQGNPNPEQSSPPADAAAPPVNASPSVAPSASSNGAPDPPTPSSAASCNGGEADRHQASLAAMAEAAATATAAELAMVRDKAVHAAQAVETERALRAAAETEAENLRATIRRQSTALGSMHAQLRGLREAAATNAREVAHAPPTSPDPTANKLVGISAPRSGGTTHGSSIGSCSCSSASGSSSSGGGGSGLSRGATGRPSRFAATLDPQAQRGLGTADARAGGGSKDVAAENGSSAAAAASTSVSIASVKPRALPEVVAILQDEEDESEGEEEDDEEDDDYDDEEEEDADDDDDDDDDYDDDEDDNEDDDEDDDVENGGVDQDDEDAADAMAVKGEQQQQSPAPLEAVKDTRDESRGSEALGAQRDDMSAAPTFIWRPVVPRGASAAVAEQLGTAQKDQRERLLARLFPDGSGADGAQTDTPRPRGTTFLSTAAADEDLADIDEATQTPSDVLAAQDLVFEEAGDEKFEL